MADYTPVGDSGTLFYAVLDSRPVMIKFVQRYGLDVHRAWAAAQLAPPVLHHRILPGGWQLIIMEGLDLQLWQPLSQLETVQHMSAGAARTAALAALSTAHTLEVWGSGQPRSVHGDVRGANVLVNTCTMPPQVLFVDFDWAGQEGVDRYPLNMSLSVVWPAGAVPNAVMQQQHDTELLSKPLSQSVRMQPFSWRDTAWV